jgi:hypothetical protein
LDNSPTDRRDATAGEQTRVADYAAEATGFGAIEFRTAKDLLLRPRSVLDAYLTRGPTAGGLYARPWGFYIALCGVLMFYLFLLGGMKGVIEQQPPAKLADWIARSGKSREAFIDDADGWMSFVAVPILSIFYALGAAPLVKWWSGLDWRRAIRATFALLCAWTVPMLPFGPLPLMKGYELLGLVVTWGALIVAFLRMGQDIWFRTWPGGIFKAVLLLVAIFVAASLGMVPVVGIGVLGGLYGA